MRKKKRIEDTALSVILKLTDEQRLNKAKRMDAIVLHLNKKKRKEPFFKTDGVVLKKGSDEYRTKLFTIGGTFRKDIVEFYKV